MTNRRHRRRRVPRVPAVPLEKATPERLQHTQPDELEVIAKVTQRIVSAPLDALWRAGRITQREYEAGDRLRADARTAGIGKDNVTMNWDSAGSASFGPRTPSMFSAQVVATARVRYRRVMAAISGTVWDILAYGVIDEKDMLVLGRDVIGVRGQRHHAEQRVAGLAGLKVALGALADHYES